MGEVVEVGRDVKRIKKGRPRRRAVVCLLRRLLVLQERAVVAVRQHEPERRDPGAAVRLPDCGHLPLHACVRRLPCSRPSTRHRSLPRAPAHGPRARGLGNNRLHRGRQRRRGPEGDDRRSRPRCVHRRSRHGGPRRPRAVCVRSRRAGAPPAHRSWRGAASGDGRVPQGRNAVDPWRVWPRGTSFPSAS